MTISIRPTVPADAPLLPAIEQSAGELFRTVPELAWIADGDNIPPQRHLELIAGGACWVAQTQGGSLAGFLAAEQAGDVLHIWELAVLQDQQRKGIGRALMAEAIAFAREQDLRALTLSTFRGVAWNEPMYLRLGFTVLSPEDCDERLLGVLRNEIAAGLPGERRCAMRMHLALTAAA
ncbi:GNAT family N-acetyltransferase [Novosphingobium sp.]|uniref:GNAT family N-acetyltransferase n=1 Tax=Novosphingobium sp. TaxID=1874826 RepID=UPI003BAC067E